MTACGVTMMRLARNIFLVVLLSPATIAAAAESPFTGPTKLVAPAQPATMPEFALADVRGGTLRASDMQGKVIVIRFWATW